MEATKLDRIDHELATLRRQLAALDAESRDTALELVDRPELAKRLDEIELERGSVERRFRALQGARAQATDAEAIEAQHKAHRQRQAARDRAVELLRANAATAKRIDEALDELIADLHEIVGRNEEIARATWNCGWNSDGRMSSANPLRGISAVIAHRLRRERLLPHLEFLETVGNPSTDLSAHEMALLAHDRTKARIGIAVPDLDEA